ncbi:AMP-binding protein [Candidatus Babeliales bacterium]|nr:AMP-binding protein [Candidatus Babeliales bacterium]
MKHLNDFVGQVRTEAERYALFCKHFLNGDHRVVPAASLQRAAKDVPKHVALICDNQSITYGDLYGHASYVSHFLVAKGVKPGETVFILLDNSIEFFIAYYGIWQTGAVVAPLNTFLHAKELEQILADAEPKFILTSKSFLDVLKGAAVTVLLEEDFLPKDITKNDSEFEIIERKPEELSVLLYTSGTTGTPKGVMLSDTNIMTNVLQVIARFGFVGEERVFGVFPLFHSFAQVTCVWATPFAQATAIIIPKIERKYIVTGLEQKPTIFLGVPALYGGLCLLRNAPVDSVEYFLCGGDALPDKIRGGFAMVYGRKIANGYGLTEASPVVAATLQDDILPSDTAGYPLQGITLSIRDEHGNDVPHGTIGVLWVKGDNIMLGYYKAPQATEEVLKDGWLCTGDCAYLDQAGRVVITGREKDLIIHKGFNIYPQEIENIIMTHAQVRAVAVVGVPDEDGEVPVAFVQLKKASHDIEAELKQLCEQNLGGYKVPRDIKVLDELPQTSLGKLDKKELRKMIHTSSDE